MKTKATIFWVITCALTLILPLTSHGQRSEIRWQEWLFKPLGQEVTDSPPRPVIILNATLLTGTGERLTETDILLEDGRISRIGRSLNAPATAITIDGAREADIWVTPGLIDTGFHAETADSKFVEKNIALNNGIEGNNKGGDTSDLSTRPLSKDSAIAVGFVEDAIDTESLTLRRARAGGITSVMASDLEGTVFPSFRVASILRTVPSNTLAGMRLPQGASALVWSCHGPEAVAELRSVLGYLRGSGVADSPVSQTLKSALVGVRTGTMKMVVACDESRVLSEVVRYLVDSRVPLDMVVSREGYRMAESLTNRSVCVSVPWGQGYQSARLSTSEAAVAVIDAARQRRGCAILASAEIGDIGNLQRLSAYARGVGISMGLEIPLERVIDWVTSNPAKALGIYEQVGSLERGKLADVVVWSGNPFSTFSRPLKVIIGGQVVFESAATLQETSSNPEPIAEDDF